MINPFFENDEFFIDEKVQFIKLANEYKVYDSVGEQIGVIAQKLSTGQKIMKLFLNGSMLPFHIEIQDANDNLLSSVSRGWTFWMSKITVNDANGQPIGTIKQKFKFLKPEFTILDTSDNVAGMIKGDWKAWNFSITDATSKEIGTINKKWGGAVKEIFTNADKYNVTINPEVAEDKIKTLILSAAITIDMVLKEQQK